MSKSVQPLILASQSPRRREILQQIGVVFEPVSVDVPEVRQVDETPMAYIARLARDKAQAGLSCAKPQQYSLGSDTVCLLGEKVLEKPLNEAEAIQMLQMMAGKTHRVATAVCLTNGEHLAEAVSVTEVSFRQISEAECRRYWSTQEPCDKAGGYGIQGLGAVFVEQIKGSYSGVMGLPIEECYRLFKEFNIPYWQA